MVESEKSLPSSAFAVTWIPLVLALSCMPGQAAAEPEVQKINKTLIESAEDTVEEIEKTEKQLEKTVNRYNELLKKNKVEDRRKEYKRLKDELKKMEERIRDLRRQTEDMERDADKFFLEWSKGLARINDPELRSLSEESLEANRSRYKEVVAAGHRAAAQYQDFATDLRAHIAYLALDMSDSAVEKLEVTSVSPGEQAEALSSSIDDLTKATKDYIKTMK